MNWSGTPEKLRSLGGWVFRSKSLLNQSQMMIPNQSIIWAICFLLAGIWRWGRTQGVCSLGWVKSDETLGTDVVHVVRSLYEVLGNVERIVELGGMNRSKFSIPFILINSNWSGQIDSQSQSMVKGRLTSFYEQNQSTP